MEIEDKLLWERAFKKFDDIDTSIKDLCKTTAEVETKVDIHIAAQEKKAVRKEKVFYVVIAAIATVFSVLSFVREKI